MVIPETNILAKTYQPKSVLNQCGSIDIIQSQDIIDSVTIKNARNPADNLKFLMWFEIPSDLSCAIENFLEKNSTNNKTIAQEESDNNKEELSKTGS